MIRGERITRVHVRAKHKHTGCVCSAIASRIAALFEMDERSEENSARVHACMRGTNV
jgi:hypothetical protein